MKNHSIIKTGLLSFALTMPLAACNTADRLAEIGRPPGGDGRLVFQRGSETVREVGAGQEVAIPVAPTFALHQFEIAGAARLRLLDNPGGYALDNRMEGHCMGLIHAR